MDHCRTGIPRSSNREARIRLPFLFSVVYFSRGTLPTKKHGERALLEDLDPVLSPGNTAKLNMYPFKLPLPTAAKAVAEPQTKTAFLAKMTVCGQDWVTDKKHLDLQHAQ